MQRVVWLKEVAFAVVATRMPAVVVDVVVADWSPSRLVASGFVGSSEDGFGQRRFCGGRGRGA